MTPEALRERLALIVVTDPDCGPGREILPVARLALEGGAPAIQLRAKNASAREATELGRALLRETRSRGALLFVNDRIDVALAIGADGAHLGSDDLPLDAARRIVPHGFILGRSVDRADEVIAVASAGPDYLGAGPVYATASKPDAGPVMGLDGLRALTQAAGSLPVVAIGGIDAGNGGAVVEAGACGLAVIGAVMRAADPRDATAELLRVVRRES